MISSHIFIFPFCWKKTDASLLLATNFGHNEFVDKVLKGESNGWMEVDTTRFNSSDEYNEYNYFYPNVRNVIGVDNSSLLRHLKYNLKEKSTYTIEICPDANVGIGTKIKTYELIIQEIHLKIYYNGIGIISFHLENHDHSDKDDILAINQFGRRLYPPFLGADFALSTPQSSELPVSIKTIINKVERKSDFAYFANRDKVVKKRMEIPCIIADLLFLHHNPRYEIYPIFDDRMFVVCWYGAENLITAPLSIKNEHDGKHGYVKNDFWYKFVFIDFKEKTIWNEPMQEEILMKHTYGRWLNYKYEGSKSPTLFGLSRYSFVSLTSPSNYLVRVHTQTLYFKIAELCLLQRASIINYSKLVSRITNKINNHSDLLAEDVKEDIKSLYLEFVRFLNEIHFREVTHQDQGIELYDRLQDVMRIPDHIKDLETEIKELHNFLLIKQTEQQTETSLNLTKIATIFLPISILTGFIGLSTIDQKLTPDLFFSAIPQVKFWISFFFIIIFSTVVIWILNKKYNLGIGSSKKANKI